MTSRLIDAARQLAGSARGREALEVLQAWFNRGGLCLDQDNQFAVCTLLEGASGHYAGTTREAIAEALADAGAVRTAGSC